MEHNIMPTLRLPVGTELKEWGRMRVLRSGFVRHLHAISLINILSVRQITY